MLRRQLRQHHSFEPYIWIVLWFVLTMLLLLTASLVMPQPAIAAVSQVGEPPGCVLYRSEQRLPDQTQAIWHVVLLKQVPSGQAPSLSLKLVGLPGAAEVAHPQPLQIQTHAGDVLMAADMFLEDAPAPTVGQYNVKDFIAGLPIEDVLLDIPTVGNRSVSLQIPRSVVQEWQDVINQG